MLRQVLFAGLILFQVVLPVRGQTVIAQTAESFPEVGLSIQPPEGFEKATTFHGVQQLQTEASIMISEIPGPFSEVIQGFTSEQLEARGIRLLTKQWLIEDQKVLMQVSQKTSSRGHFRKWLLAFSDQQNKTKLVVATFPEDASEKLSESLKKAVLSASLIPQSFAISTLPFSITPSSELVEVQEVQAAGKVRLFSKDGVLKTPAPEDPLFIVAPSLGDVPIYDPEAFALHRLGQVSQLQTIEVEKIQAISINNQDGFEIIATAKDRQSQAPLRIYQAMLFPEKGGYVVMIGMVGQDDPAQYMSEFQKMAQTYQHTPQPSPAE